MVYRAVLSSAGRRWAWAQAARVVGVVVTILRLSSATKSSRVTADIPAIPSTCLSPKPADRNDSRTTSCEIVSARTRRPPRHQLAEITAVRAHVEVAVRNGLAAIVIQLG